MPHYVYEIPRGIAPNRQIGAYPDYLEASTFAKAERERRAFADETLILVVHAQSIEQADASAERLRAKFEEARQARPAPVARVSQFLREYPAEPTPEALPPPSP